MFAKLSELLKNVRKRDRNVIKASKHIRWSVNALRKLITAVSKNKFSYRHQGAQSSEQQKLLRVNLHLYESRTQYVSLERKRFIQVLIDNISSRLLNVADASSIESFKVLYPQFWPDVETP